VRCGRHAQALVAMVVAACAFTACSGEDSLPEGERPATTAPAPEGITVQLGGTPTPIDPRLFGVNLPAWAGPERLADPEFQRKAMESGATVVRMPGGSWSSSYSWLACEQRNADDCFWTWAARPSDYAGFLAATGLAGMWTVSYNGTAHEAAALVAFFNGTVDDTRVIGVDRNGFDWGTVGQWAELRAAGGHPDPVTVQMWEVGNEVYGAKAEAEGNCASFGWEDVWTCDGQSYVEGDADHDGFVAFSKAMRDVDPSISVGAVGVPDPKSWSDFGNEVMQSAAGLYDFYVVHDYGFQNSASTDDVLRRPIDAWPGIMTAVEDGLQQHEPDRAIAVAITEYNLVSFQDGDTDALMDHSINALYLADMIGQMAMTGVSIANLWNLVNGKAANGTDYGLVDADTGELNPAYYALATWAHAGDELLAMTSSYDAELGVSAYAARSSDGSVCLIVINKTDQPTNVDVTLDGGQGAFDWSATAAYATALDAGSMTTAEEPAIATQTSAASVPLKPYSITRIEMSPSPAG
jgi:hypothetical protein